MSQNEHLVVKNSQQSSICESSPSSSTSTLSSRITVVRGHRLYEVRRRPHVPSPSRGISKLSPFHFRNAWIVMTPVNTLTPTTELSVAAKADYIQEEKKIITGEHFPMWDDPDPRKKAEAHPGDLFGFVHNQKASGKDLVELFEVTDKKDVSHRPAHWTIPAHQDRKVVVLSRYMAWVSFTELSVAMGRRVSSTEGKNCLRGTERQPWPTQLEVFME